MRKRSIARVLILAALFQVDLGKLQPEDALDNVQYNLDEEILENIIQNGDGEAEKKGSLGLKKILTKGDKLREYFKDEEFKSFIGECLLGILKNQSELDSLIMEKAQNWQLDRVAKVEKNILRMALYEMLYRVDIPLKVSIDEAVELAKIFGDRESGRFVNGILGAVKQKEGE